MATYTKIGDILDAFWKRAKKVVDAGDAATLAESKEYTDTKVGEVETTAKEYTDSVIKTSVTDKFGAANGFATLDANGQIPASQLSVSAMEFKGNWDASTNSPTLADGTGNNGDFYVVTVASGEATHLGGGFLVNDRVIYSSETNKWIRLVGDTVNSVNNQTGAINLNASNLIYKEETQDEEGNVIPAITIAQKLDLVADEAMAIEDATLDGIIGTSTDSDGAITYVPEEIDAQVVES